MSQILKSLQLSTSSTAPGTPSTGLGTLYASGSNQLFFKNASGTEFDLTATNSTFNILYYTGSAIGNGTTQTYTWNKLNNLKFIEVCCVGAGGGGGGGIRRNAAFNGGTGGGGGAIVWASFDASMLASSYTVTVGAGGAGGLGSSSTTITSNSGSDGGDTSFGNLVIAKGGRGGKTNVSGWYQSPGGSALACTPAGAPYAINGCQSATPISAGSFVTNAVHIFDPTVASINNSENNAFVVSELRGRGGGGGGYGGGLDSLSGPYSGSKGSSGYQFGTLITNSGAAGGGRNGQNATGPSTDNMITTLLQISGSTTLYGLGGGGHGGGMGSASNAGNGSDAGLYGAGGGGGGTVYSGLVFSGGTAGSGSSGLCIVMEFY